MTTGVSLFSFLWGVCFSQKKEEIEEAPKAVQICLERINKSFEEKNENQQGISPSLDFLPQELLLHISSFAPLAICGLNKNLQGVFRDEFNQRNLLRNLEPLQRIWPKFPAHLTILEKNQAILKEIRTIFGEEALAAILGPNRFVGSIDQITAIDKAYKEQENRATVVLYEAIRKQHPSLEALDGADAVREWIGKNSAILESINTLDLSMKDLLVVPREISEMKNLVELDLYKNKIKKIPPPSQFPPLLGKLVLTFNELGPVISGRAFPRKLRYLDLSGNNISDLSTIKFPGHLKTLILAGNELGPTLDKIPFPPELQHLCLRGNDILSFPKRLEELRELVYLDLSMNLFSKIPAKLSSFRKLGSLNLQDNKIRILPQKVFWPPLLYQLKLSGNGISLIPKYLKWPATLTDLDLARNGIQFFPRETRWPRGLNSVSLDHNKISSFPESFVRLPALRYLNLSDNRIGPLPEKKMVWPEGLHLLWLNDNDIPTLPQGWNKSGLTIIWQNFALKSPFEWRLW